MAHASIPNTVDALAAYKMLLDAGFTEAQAQAQSEIHRMNAELQQKAVVESMKEFVTKSDLRIEIAKATEEIKDYVKSEFATKSDLKIAIYESTESMKKYTDAKFDEVNKRFEQVEKKIEGMGSKVLRGVSIVGGLIFSVMGAMIFIMGRSLHWSGF